MTTPRPPQTAAILTEAEMQAIREAYAAISTVLWPPDVARQKADLADSIPALLATAEHYAGQVGWYDEALEKATGYLTAVGKAIGIKFPDPENGYTMGEDVVKAAEGCAEARTEGNPVSIDYDRAIAMLDRPGAVVLTKNQATGVLRAVQEKAIEFMCSQQSTEGRALRAEDALAAERETVQRMREALEPFVAGKETDLELMHPDNKTKDTQAYRFWSELVQVARAALASQPAAPATPPAAELQPLGPTSAAAGWVQRLRQNGKRAAVLLSGEAGHESHSETLARILDALQVERDAERARADAAEKERDEATARADAAFSRAAHNHNLIERTMATLAASQETVRRLREVLQPFADAATEAEDSYAPDKPTNRAGWAVDFEDLAAARAALASPPVAEGPAEKCTCTDGGLQVEPCPACRREIHEGWHAKGFSWIRPEECHPGCPGLISPPKRCSSCHAPLDTMSLDGSWRFGGTEWEHQCPGNHPQCGHFVAEFAPASASKSQSERVAVAPAAEPAPTSIPAVETLESMTTEEQKSNPGSDEALKLGCLCATVDNAHGEGFPFPGGWRFWVNRDCPLHGTPSRNDEREKAER